MSPKSKSFEKLDLPARVDRIIFNGISRTKDDVLTKLTQPIREETQTFLDLFLQAHQLRQNLLGLNGSFKSVHIVIDSTPGGNSANGFDLKVTVRESKPLTASVDTSFSPVSSNSGSVCTGARANNVLGRGESVELDYTKGLAGAHNGFSLKGTKPIVKPTDHLFSTISSCIYQSQYDFLPSLFSCQERGAACELVTWPSPILKSTVKLETSWRSISSMAAAPFTIRAMSGHFLKNAIKSSLDYDTRTYNCGDISLNFPTRGWLLNYEAEIAGLGGNQSFLKQDFHAQSNGRVPGTGILMQCTARVGLIASFRPDLAISEKFFLGGPLSLRGFQYNGVGPSCRAEGSTTLHPEAKYALGADAYWLTGLHLYAPLPFLGYKSQAADIIYKCVKLHGFLNAGCASSTFKEMPTSPIRSSIGAGLAVQAGPRIRLELNFVKPLSFAACDSVKKGVDLGFGISFS